MKKVAIIGTAGVPGRYGGFETLAHHLVKQLNKSFSLSVYNTKKIYQPHERPKFWNGARIHYLPFNANGSQSIVYDILSILHAVFYADVLVVLGVSGGIILPFVRLFTRRKIIVNIDGLEWRRQKWGMWVKKFLKFSEYLAIKFSHADITDNESIKKYAAIYYKTLSLQIEYGADHVQKVPLDASLKKKYSFLHKPYAFKVARIEPENNLHMILEAFTAFPQKNLVIVGNWDNSDYGRKLKKDFAPFPNIFLLDPIYDQTSLDQIRANCHVYIHGHSAGGTNPSLVEAMYLGLPVVAFDVSYNVATTENKALFFKDTMALKNIVKNTTFSAYRKNAGQMIEIAKRRYTWEIIAKKYANLILSFDHQYVKKPVFSKLSKLDNNWLIKNEFGHMRNSKLYYE
jgi:glycosyltransferase involved in cell wall biosynthesis